MSALRWLRRRDAAQPLDPAPILTLRALDAELSTNCPNEAVDITRRWRQAGSTQRAALTAATNEIEQTATFVEQNVVTLADRFTSLAFQATSQSDQVRAMMIKSDRIVAGSDNMSLADLTDLFRNTLSKVVERIMGVSKNAASMGGALTDVSDSVGRIGSLMSELKRINQQTKMLALNATIEAARAEGAGLGFAVVAEEVKHLSLQTAELSQAMQTEIATIGTAVRRGAGILEQVANEDMTDDLASRQRLELLLAALLQRRQEIDQVIEQAAQGSVEIAGEISSIVGAFQFQDRSKQRLMHVVDILRAVDALLESTDLADAATSGVDGTPPLPDSAWLDELARSFTMTEVRERFRAALPGGQAHKPMAPDAAAADAFQGGELDLF